MQHRTIPLHLPLIFNCPFYSVSQPCKLSLCKSSLTLPFVFPHFLNYFNVLVWIRPIQGSWENKPDKVSQTINLVVVKLHKGFSRWLSSEESTCNAGEAGDAGLIYGSGKSPGVGRVWQPNLVFLPEEIPWTEEPDGLPSTGSLRVGHKWSDLGCMLSTQTCASTL